MAGRFLILGQIGFLAWLSVGDEHSGDPHTGLSSPEFE
jgi:hypothetical protein